MATPFDTFLNLAVQNGIFAFYLPFLLVLTLFYGLLDKTKILGKEGKRLNMIIALIAALYVMLFNQGLSLSITTFFATFFAGASIVLVTILVGIMVIGLLLSGPITDETWEKVWKRAVGGIVMLGFIIAIFLFSSAGGFNLFTTVAPGLTTLDADTVMLIIIVAVTVFALWFMTRGEEK